MAGVSSTMHTPPLGKISKQVPALLLMQKEPITRANQYACTSIFFDLPVFSLSALKVQLAGVVLPHADEYL